MSFEELPEVLTVEEAAAVLRIGRTAAYELCRQWRTSGGRQGLPVVAFGRTLPRAQGRAPEHAPHLGAPGMTPRPPRPPSIPTTNGTAISLSAVPTRPHVDHLTVSAPLATTPVGPTTFASHPHRTPRPVATTTGPPTFSPHSSSQPAPRTTSTTTVTPPSRTSPLVAATSTTPPCPLAFFQHQGTERRSPLSVAPPTSDSCPLPLPRPKSKETPLHPKVPGSPTR